MHQKAQLIATIMNEPDLLIVDEPFQGLDPVNAEMLKGVLLEQRDRGAAVVMSTHDMGDAQTLCDRILLIDEGRRVLYGTVPDVRGAFSDGAVEVVGSDIPPTRAASGASATRRRSTARSATCCATARRAQDLFRELAATDADRRALRGRGARPRRDLHPRRGRRSARGASRERRPAPPASGRGPARALRCGSCGVVAPARLRAHRPPPRLHLRDAAAAPRAHGAVRRSRRCCLRGRHQRPRTRRHVRVVVVNESARTSGSRRQ